VYDQEHFIKTLSNTTCIFTFDEKKDKLLPPTPRLPYSDETTKSGWHFQRKVNEIRHMAGYIVSTEIFGLYPETMAERAIQHKMFDAFKINHLYQELADQYYNYIQNLALSRGGVYSAIHLRIELDSTGRRPDPNSLQYLVEQEIGHETTVLYLAMGQTSPEVLDFYKTFLCDDRPWQCLRKEDIPIHTDLLFNFDTAFTVEVQLLTNAQSVILDRGSTMSWIAMGERMKRGLDFQWAQQPIINGVPAFMRLW